MIERFQARPAQLGVTLLELIVVIAILGILAAIAIPSYADYVNRQRIIGATESIYGQMVLAKRSAVSNNREILFVVKGSGTDSWCVTYSQDASVVNNDCTGGYTAIVGNSSTLVSSADFPGVVLVASDSVVGFRMPGLQAETGSLVISIPSSGLGSNSVKYAPGFLLLVCGSVGSYEDC